MQTVQSFRKSFSKTPLIIASLTEDRPRKKGDIDILPWKTVLKLYQEKYS